MMNPTQKKSCISEDLTNTTTLDTLIRDGLILPLSPDYPEYFRGSVGIRGDKIVYIQASESAQLPSAKKIIEARGRLVMPGLINAHIHGAMTLFRGLADDLPLQVWLEKHIFPAEAGFLSSESVYWGTLLACAEMLLSGTTTCADGYFFMNAAAKAYARSGLRALVCQGVLDFSIPGIPDPLDNISAAARFVDTWEKFSPLIQTGIFCHSPYTCSSETLRNVKKICLEKGVPFFIHAAETRDEVFQISSREGKTPIRYLQALGLLDRRTVIVHGVHVDGPEMEALAQSGTALVHCPESNMKLASGIAPVVEMMGKGIPVGLGTDGCASNNDLDLFKEMDTAAKLQKVHYGDPAVMEARKVVQMATSRGAAVLGLAHQVGTLEIGKKADLILVDMTGPHWVPCYDPFSHLVYAARGSDVLSVMIAGKMAVENRKILSFDLNEVLDKVNWFSRQISNERTSLLR
jgi:5-methylthioadenosine/S-adenosylhomocysteine deaminase